MRRMGRNSYNRNTIFLTKSITSRFLVNHNGHQKWAIQDRLKIFRVKMWLCLHPEGWHSAIVSAETRSNSTAFIFLRGNTNNGGTNAPPAFMHVTTVTSALLSTTVTAPICFFFVSGWWLHSWFQNIKKLSIFSGLKPFILFFVINSGFLKDRLGGASEDRLEPFLSALHLILTRDGKCYFL